MRGFRPSALCHGQDQPADEYSAKTILQYLLADFKLALRMRWQARQRREVQLPPEHEIEQIVRQGVADAFADASLDMVADPAVAGVASGSMDSRRYEGGDSQSWMPRPALGYAGTGSIRANAGTSKARMSKKMLAFLGVLRVAFGGCVQDHGRAVRPRAGGGQQGACK